MLCKLKYHLLNRNTLNYHFSNAIWSYVILEPKSLVLTNLWKTAEQSWQTEVWLSKGNRMSPSLQSSHTNPLAWQRYKYTHGHKPLIWHRKIQRYQQILKTFQPYISTTWWICPSSSWYNSTVPSVGKFVLYVWAHLAV